MNVRCPVTSYLGVIRDYPNRHTSIMIPVMRLLLLPILLAVLQSCSASGDSGPNSPIFNLDHTALEKNLAAIFNKVAHSSATTKRSVPAYDAQVSASTTTLSTVPSPLTTSAITISTTTTTVNPSIPAIRYPAPKATPSPSLRDLPSYAPPSRALFTPPLPPEYLHPFADKPTLRGTNSDVHTGNRRPIPPPSLTPAHERIPFRPPDLPQGPSQDVTEKHHSHTSRNKSSINGAGGKEQHRHKPAVGESVGEGDRTMRNNTNNEFVTLHYPSISRILSGSNGRKQDIPEILLKPLPTKNPLLNHVPPAPSTDRTSQTPSTVTPRTSSSGSVAVDHPVLKSATEPTIFNLPNTGHQDNSDDDNDDNDDGGGDYRVGSRNKHGVKKTNGDIEIVDAERLPYPQAQPPAPTSKRPNEVAVDNGDRLVPHVDTQHPLESTWRIAWSLHVYVAAIMFTLMALYSIYKIVRFNEATNLLTQTYFLTVHLLLTTVCTLRCFHLFYDAYNLGHSLPVALSSVLMYLPAPLLSTAFATLVLYLARCSEAPSLNNSILSPTTLVLSSTVHIVLCVSLHVSTHVFGYQDEAGILSLICECIYIVVCVTLGLCYMYVYRVARSQIHMASNKAAGANHTITGTDPTTVALSTAITTTIATALLFILMGLVQLYGIFGVQERPQPYPWLWWGWQFSVRLLELSVCGLLAWVASLSQYPLREKQMQQHSAHSGFALFPCGSSTSTENMDDVLYPAICSTNQAIQNYTMRTGKQVYDDSFPLNTLPEHLNISGTFERHSIRKSGTMGHFPHEGRGSLNRHGNGVQTLRNSETRGRHTPVQGLHEQAPTNGSTMLVAEDGFVRFRSLGAEEDELSDTQSMIGTHGRGSSLAGSVRYNARHPTTVPHQHSHQHQHSLQHSHPSQHQSHHQLYNNT